jgi:hypothetical protein
VDIAAVPTEPEFTLHVDEAVRVVRDAWLSVSHVTSSWAILIHSRAWIYNVSDLHLSHHLQMTERRSDICAVFSIDTAQIAALLETALGFDRAKLNKAVVISLTIWPPWEGMTWLPYAFEKSPCCACCAEAVLGPAVFCPVLLSPGAACIISGGKDTDGVVLGNRRGECARGGPESGGGA